MLLDLSSWWSALGGLEKVYWILAIPFSLIFLFLLITTLIGGDIEGDMADVDAEIDGDAGIGLQFISIKNLVGFFTIFAWSGLACQSAGLGTFVSILISTLCGLAMMLLMASIFFFMSKLAENGTLNLNNAIHKVGEVYLTIPASRNGFGKVQINVQGGFRELDAMTDQEETLAVGTIVQVLEIIDEHILLVKKSGT